MMVRRSGVGIASVASLDNLTAAFWRAATGKRQRPEVVALSANLDIDLAAIGRCLRAGEYRFGPLHRFEIRDPKRRWIHAPCFRDRVVHHALMHVVGPVLDRALVSDTYACRLGKGTDAAVQRAKQQAGRFLWFAKLDVRAYFSSIDHRRLFSLLRRRLKDPGVLRLCADVLDGYRSSPGCGLPIGALTSQHFANFYLGGLDRFLLEELRVAGMVRYMDDVVFWGGCREDLTEQLDRVRSFAAGELSLEIHRTQVQRTRRGMTFCGYRVFPHRLLLTRRRKLRYRRARVAWERAYELGCIDAAGLQAGFAAALAITHGADARGFRAEDLSRRVAVEC